MQINDLEFTIVTHQGRPFHLWSDGTLLPVVRGGDGPDDDNGDDADEDANKGGGGSGDESGSRESESSAANGDKVEMTQAEIDAMISKRLEKAKKSWEDEAKTKADREKMDEADRLKAEKADAEKQAADKVAAANGRLVRTEAKAEFLATEGTDPKKADRFVKLLDLDGIEVDDDGTVDAKAVAKAVADTLKEFPEFKAATGGAGGGDFNSSGDKKPTGLAGAVAARYAS